MSLARRSEKARGSRTCGELELSDEEAEEIFLGSEGGRVVGT
ncbi:MAG: hypothetical protein QXK94_04810 [Candidatus Jordarchaeales archaeon]